MHDADPTHALFHITATDHAAMQSLALEHKKRIASVLPAGAEIEHVGATAVPGCLTKGDIDLAVRVAAHDFAAAELALAALLERNSDSHRSADFASFCDPDARPELGVQLVAAGSAFDFFATFRDALIADPALLARYNTLKLTWDGRDMEAYRVAKSAFVELVLGLAETDGASRAAPAS